MAVKLTASEKMEKRAFELSKRYYPKYWPVKSIKALVDAGKLTEEHYKEVTGFTYPNMK